jgi:glycosyltransferase involved in cell wall biosynthesis
MRICLVHNDYGKPSGEEMIMENQARLLKTKGHEVIHFRRSSSEIFQMPLGKIRAFFSGIYSFSSKGAMLRLLVKYKMDIVHVHNVFPLISPSILGACRKAGVPIVMTVHNYRLVCPNGLHTVDGQICERCRGGKEYWCVFRNCEDSLFKSFGYALRNFVARKRRMFLDNVTVYACLTEFQKQRLVAEGFPAERIEVISNISAISNCELGSMLGDHVGFIGRVSPEKGISILMLAASQCPDIKFKVAGAYDRMPHLPAETISNLEFLGHIEPQRITGFYDSCRIIVLPSICFEGFPATLVEAMFRGKPIICSRIGGLSEIVEDGVTGLLFQPGDAHELKVKVRYLWNRPELCQKLGQAGREKALREYSPQKYYERLIAVYQKAMQLVPNHRLKR